MFERTKILRRAPVVALPLRGTVLGCRNQIVLAQFLYSDNSPRTSDWLPGSHILEPEYSDPGHNQNQKCPGEAALAASFVPSGYS
jgi:hypothetical protein